jgi:CRP-like cAMP-binding protein
VSDPKLLLDHMAIFATLTDRERAALAANLRRRSYQANETIIEPGASIQALSIVRSGVLVASRPEGDGEVELRRLSPGDFFGEGGVLTGAVARVKIVALTKTVIYEISKEDLAPLLKDRPSIATELGQILAHREATLREGLEQHAEHTGRRENMADWLSERMRTLFHLK